MLHGAFTAGKYYVRWMDLPEGLETSWICHLLVQKQNGIRKRGSWQLLQSLQHAERLRAIYKVYGHVSAILLEQLFKLQSRRADDRTDEHLREWRAGQLSHCRKRSHKKSERKVSLVCDVTSAFGYSHQYVWVAAGLSQGFAELPAPSASPPVAVANAYTIRYY